MTAITTALKNNQYLIFDPNSGAARSQGVILDEGSQVIANVPYVTETNTIEPEVPEAEHYLYVQAYRLYINEVTPPLTIEEFLESYGPSAEDMSDVVREELNAQSARLTKIA